MTNDNDDYLHGRRGGPCMGRTIWLTRPRTRMTSSARRPAAAEAAVARPPSRGSSSYSRSGKDPTMTETDSPQDLPIDPVVRAEVARIWREWIGMDPSLPETERDEQIDREAARLTEMVQESVGDSPHGFLVEQWRREHPGQDPDHRTTVALIETAWNSARARVLENELYPQLSEEDRRRTETTLAELVENSDRQASELTAQRDPDRWRTLMVEVSELAERIVNRVWGTRGSLEFQELALALIQQRLDDNLPTPMTSADPLRDELEAMIEGELEVQL